jgi:Mg2+ and Co2+ transporter CorA
MDMMFFNKKSEIDKIRDDIEGVILYFKKDNELIDNHIKELYRSINTVEQLSNDKISREVAYIERRIDEVNNDIKTLTNIGIALFILVMIFVCVVCYNIIH